MTLSAPAVQGGDLGDLFAALDARSSGATACTVELYELLCAVEQTLADISSHATVAGIPVDWDDTLAGLRVRITEVAGALWFGRPVAGQSVPVLSLPDPVTVAEVRDQVATIEQAQLSEESVLSAIVPECRTQAPIDYGRYAAAAASWFTEHLPADEKLVVVGIRTGGSYLAPLWAAARPGGRYTTMRPQVDELMGAARAATDGQEDRSVLVVDDVVGSGRTMATMLAALRDATRAPVHGVVHQRMRQLTTADLVDISVLKDVAPRIPPAGRGRPEANRDYFAAAITELSAGTMSVTSVERLPPSYWIRYLAAMTGLHTRTLEVGFVAGSGRHYRLACTSPEGPVQVFAKYVGLAAVTALQLSRFADGPGSPRVRGIAGGYLFYDWVAGSPLAFAAPVNDSDLRLMAGTAAELTAIPPLRLPPAWFRSNADEVCARLQDAGGDVPEPAELIRVVDVPPALRGLPANHGHWHWVRGPDGRLSRLNREVVDRKTRLADVCEDLAAMAVELAPSDRQLDALRNEYADLTGDRVADGRLAFAGLRYAAGVLAEYEYYDRIGSRFSAVARPDGTVAAFRQRRSGVVVRALDLYRTLTR